MSEKLLVTGFDAIAPTAGTLDNPAALCAAWVHEEFRRYGVVGAILPTSYRDCGNRITQILTDVQPTMVLMLGQAASPYFRLETRARNRDTSDRPDNDGQRSNAVIIPGGSEWFDATLPYDPILDALDGHDLPVSLSGDAGDYLCNRLFAEALSHIAATSLDIRCGFMHIPSPAALEDATAFGREGWIRQGVGIAVRSLIEAPRL